MRLGRVVIITVEPVEEVSNAELEVELRKRLNSKSFSIERIKILDDQGQADASHLRIFPLRSNKERS